MKTFLPAAFAIAVILFQSPSLANVIKGVTSDEDIQKEFISAGKKLVVIGYFPSYWTASSRQFQNLANKFPTVVFLKSVTEDGNEIGRKWFQDTYGVYLLKKIARGLPKGLHANDIKYEAALQYTIPNTPMHNVHDVINWKEVEKTISLKA